MKMTTDEDSEVETKRKKSKPITDARSPFQYPQFLGLTLVLGFLIIGSAAGNYTILEDLMVAPCLGCLGLYPNVDLDFTFDTVDGQDHADFILDILPDAPVFIEFTQNDENCPPCKRMRPKVHELVDDYNENVAFYIININENEVYNTFQNEEQTDSIQDSEEEDIYSIYDLKNIAQGRVATPTYIIVTLDIDDSGNVRPSFAVGYGEFVEENAQKTKEGLAQALDYALAMHHHHREMYLIEE
jgi:thiol-disulfide isomerase/thioredoxin